MPIKPNEKSFITKTLVQNLANLIELHQNGAYRSIKGKLTLDMTNTATPPTFIEDGLLKFIKALGVRKNGKVFRHNVPLRIHYYVEMAIKGKPPKKTDPVTTASATYNAIVYFTIDFAKDKLNEFDLSALQQTKNLSQFELVVQTGTVSDIASANAPTINSVTLDIATRYFTGTTNDGYDINDDSLVTLRNITETTEDINLEVNRLIYDKSSQDVPLVAGSRILETAFILTDNGVRSDSRITDLKFKRIRPNEDEILETTWDNLHGNNITEYNIENDVVGFSIIDWKEKLDPVNGLITGARTNDVIQLLTNGIVALEDKLEIYTRSE